MRLLNLFRKYITYILIILVVITVFYYNVFLIQHQEIVQEGMNNNTGRTWNLVDEKYNFLKDDKQWGGGLGVACNGQMCIVVGIVRDGGGSCMAYSKNGKEWTINDNVKAALNSITGIAYDGGAKFWVAVGYNTKNGNNIATSDDGITWAGFKANCFDQTCAVAAWGAKFIIVGKGSSSIAWMKNKGSVNPMGKLIFEKGLGVARSKENWVAVGWKGNGKASIGYSKNGDDTWTAVTDSTKILNQGNGIACKDNICCAVGQNDNVNTMAISKDSGVTWTGLGKKIFDEGKSVNWNGKNWIATGSKAGKGVIAYSTDAENWTVATPSSSSFNTINSAACNNTFCAAVGQGRHSILYGT